MKKFTSFSAAVVAALALAAPAQAQLTFDWDDNGQFKFYPEDLVCEGGVVYDEDEGAFVFDGTPGTISLPIPEGQTFDWTQVASIQVIGSIDDEEGESHELTYYAWNDWDPLATFTIKDRDVVNSDGEDIVNTWMGSRYSVNLSGACDKEYALGTPWAQLCGHVTAAYWSTRNEINGEEEGEKIAVDGVPGTIYIDEVVFTKSVEIDPMAISPDMFYEWDNWDGTAQPLNLAGCEYNLEKGLEKSAVVYGTSVVLGRQYADLTEYAGIYGKGTPGVSLRLLFNRPDMDGGSAPITECNPTFDEEGEFYFYFADLETAELDKFGEAYPYVHLNTVKMAWELPEGVETAKVIKLNYIEKGGETPDDPTESLLNVAADKATDNVIFNVYGQRVSDSYKGIVVKNGKKYFNK